MSELKTLQPVVDALSRPFWQAARAHHLVLPRCEGCQTLRAHFERWCAVCGDEHFQWERLSGRGKVWSHCIFHRIYFPSSDLKVPYNVVVVALEEGPRLISNIVGIDSQFIEIDMPVIVHFEDMTEEISLVKFKPLHFSV
jgi:hypothetical protein